MEDTWSARELPVLDAVVSLFEEAGVVGGFPTVAEIADRTRLPLAAVAQSLDAMDGAFLEFQKRISGGDPTNWFVNRVYPEARVVVGQWPTPETLIDRLIAALDAAADAEPDEERKSKLRQVSAALGGAVRDVAVGVAASVIGHSIGT